MNRAREKEFQLGNVENSSSSGLVKKGKQMKAKDESFRERRKTHKRIGKGDKSRGNVEERVVSSVWHSEKSSQIKLNIGSLASGAGAIMTFCCVVSVERGAEAVVQSVGEWRQ